MLQRIVLVTCILVALPCFAREVVQTGDLPDDGVFVGDIGELSLRVLGSNGLVGNVGARKTQFIQYLNMSEGFARDAATSGADANLGSTIYQSTLDRFPDVPAWETTVTAHEPGRRAAFETTGRLHSPFRETGEFERVGEEHWRGEVTWTREPVEGARMRLAVYLFAWLQEQPLTIVRPDGSRVDQLDGERLRAWAAREHGVFEAGTRIVLPIGIGETAIFTIHQQARLTSFNFGVFFGGFWVAPTDADAEQMRITIERISDPLQVVSGDLTATVEAHSGEAAIHHGPFKLIEHVELIDGDARQGDVLPVDGWQSTREGDAVEATGDLASTWTERVEPAQSALGGGALKLSVQREEAGGEARLRLVLPPVYSPPEGEPVSPVYSIWEGGVPIGPDGGRATIELPEGRQLEIRADANCRLLARPASVDRTALILVIPEGSSGLGLTLDIGWPRYRSGTHTHWKRDYLRLRTASTGVESGLEVRRDEPRPGCVQIVSPWWTVTHTESSGAISGIDFCYGRPGSIIHQPISLVVSARGGQDAKRWEDSYCRDAEITVEQRAHDHVVVTVHGNLPEWDGTPGPVDFQVVCDYRETFVRRTVRLNPREPVPGVGAIQVAFANARTKEFVGGRTNPIWGTAQPSGRSYERRGYPEYIALFERDVECLEVFPTEDLTQWAQVTGDPEDCSWRIGGRSMVLYGFRSRDRIVTLTEPLEFSHYIGLPPVSAANREKNAWHMLGPSASEEEVRRLAYTGVDSIHGLVSDPIRTGSDRDWERATTGSRDLVERCHRYGLEIVPYLYFLTMHPDNPVFAEHEAEWQMHNRRRDQACAVSEEWREHYLAGARRLIEEGGYDGLYYDFVNVYTCQNPAHGPVPHSTVEGLMATLQGTREVIGEDGMLIGHRGHQANTVIDSSLDGVVVFEHYAHPHWLPLDELTALNTFVGASRRDTCTKSLVCSIGGLNPRDRRQEGPRVIDTDEILCKLALQGLFPYSFINWSDEVLDRYFHYFACFRSVNFSRVTFMDHLHQPAVRSDDPYIRAAAYFGEGEAYVVVANPESDEPRDTSFRVDVREFGWDAEQCAISEQPDGTGARRISADDLRAGIECSLKGYGYRVYMLRALDDEARVVSSTHQWEEADGRIMTRGPVGQECTLIVAADERPEAVTLNGEVRAGDAWTWDEERGMATIGYTCAATDEEQVFVVR